VVRAWDPGGERGGGGKTRKRKKRRRERKVKKRGSKQAKQETILSRQLSGTDSPVQGEITNAELKLFSSCLYLYLAVALFFSFRYFCALMFPFLLLTFPLINPTVS
jgi:hypothetical protein